ncbi:MAG TPA: YmdB family metallophosphoesterase [candidate division WWE3 bacterium]|uniref:YmdB family metallophosphoesterase n=1 Tax=candidate division WWE3 bacterium TaxID=2053526 RepID=A0A7V5J082_UNCKA|nr:YmdB family metallophosphoesterase [candidate division WWE3 bacterium]
MEPKKENELRILFIGDIVSYLGRKAVKECVPKLKKEYDVDLVVANCENTTGGRGISIDHYWQLVESGIDAFTSGEHIYRNPSILDEIENLDIAVPLNLYPSLLGKRFVSVKDKRGQEVIFVSLLGKVFMDPYVYNPFFSIQNFVEEHNNKTIIVDFHAEATSEKRAMGFFLQGKVAGVLGTHTHIPTADEQILGGKTAYITDVGMTGSKNSVIGVKKEIILKRFTTGEKERFEWEREGDYLLNAVIISIDTKGQMAKNICRVNILCGGKE